MQLGGHTIRVSNSRVRVRRCTYKNCKHTHDKPATPSPTPQTLLTSMSQQQQQPLLSCQACGRHCAGSLSCPGCKALCYCSVKHMQSHLKHQHRPDECQRMAAQLQRGQVCVHQHRQAVQTPSHTCMCHTSCCTRRSCLSTICRHGLFRYDHLAHEG